MITKEFANEFAKDWINAWNEQDVEKVLSHYTDHFIIETPRALEVVPESKGTVAGKEAVRKYWLASMKKRPNLHFQLLDVLVGVNGLSVYYLNTVTNKKAVEVMCFDRDKKVTKVIVHYGG